MYGIDVYFVVAKNKNQTINELLRKESQNFNDIIQFDFIDDYRNRTLKTISTLRWITRKCSNVKAILRTNDNVIINLDILLSNSTIIKSGITGYKGKDTRIAIKGGTEASVTMSGQLVFEQKNGVYIDGSAYILTADIIDRIISSVDNNSEHILRNEDFFITRLTANSSDVSVHQSIGFIAPFECESRNVCQMSSFIALTDCLSAEQLFDFWYEWKYFPTNCSYDFLAVASLIIVVYILILISYRISYEKIINFNANYNKFLNH